ncbi:XdhC family protein [Pseudomonas sp. 5Ae-yellow]|uniref:XdhC family protein n=1 Tax=Pseudomonas sp. 5Ae-yellow TaxID=2759848 RepID=UPI0015F3DC2F|nr:XdhC/CoxI family protein [Pseudomonas sp. 5Ae-yellow]MBA6420982.1 XdhC family protein [Pseudomonas sp. 5Ae-yellow]
MANFSQEPDTAVAVLGKALEWLRQGHQVALATVVRTWGSSPRRAGSMAAINETGAFCGSVSGGCVETSVLEEALEAMEHGHSLTLSFDVSDESAWSVGLACGGTIAIRVVPMTGPGAVHSELYDAVVASIGQRRSCFLVTDLASNRVDFYRTSARLRACFPGLPSGQLEAGVFNAREQQWFLNVFEPPTRLIVLGGVHIAQMLVPMAQLAGFDITVVERRKAFAAEARFPGVPVLIENAGVALGKLAPDARTAVVALTHNPELDDPGLIAALDSPAFYVGALGSRRTQEQRRLRLLECGVGLGQVERLHAPIGLPIGAATPGEIAVSILSEIVSVFRGKG